ncbi:MAG: ExeA family protein [Rickettsiales bacterium]
MYERYFGLTGKPFSLLPEAHHLFFSKRHQHIVNILEYGMQTQAAFMVITGDVGAGKTSSIRHFLDKLPPRVTVGHITNPNPRLGSLMGWVSNAFDLDQHGKDESKMYNGFVEFLLAEYAKGYRTLLIIDEAQNLSPELLEELRMLSNVNNEQDMLLQIILSGQPELLDMLNRQDLRQFAQRIGAHGHLASLTPAETQAYIRHRLAVVGSEADFFDERACAAVYHYTGGVPRLINLLCDQALMYGFAEESREIDYQTVIEVVSDRNTTGLSAFRPVTANQSDDHIRSILDGVLQMMRAGKK